MIDTQQKAADLVQEAARQGKVAMYLESLPDGNFRAVFPASDYATYAQLLYSAADKFAEHDVKPYLPVIHLRD